MASKVTLFHGADEYLVENHAKTLVGSLLPPEDHALGLELIDGDAATIDEALAAIRHCRAALETLPFFGVRKVVWFKGVNFLTDTVVGRSEAVKTAVGTLAGMIRGGLPAETSLVITATRADKRYAFYKTVAQAGEVHEFAVPEQGFRVERQAADRLTDCLKEAGLSMAEAARGRFLQRVGTDTRNIVNEVAKLVVYLGDRRAASLEDVDAVTCANRESVAWDLADAFGNRNLVQAIDVTRNLLFRRESPIALIAVLEGRIRDLMIYREAIDRGWMREGRRPDSWEWGRVPAEAETVYAKELARDPRRTHPYRASLLGKQAKLFSMGELRRSLRAAVAAHRQLVSSSLPQSFVLETLLLRTLA